MGTKLTAIFQKSSYGYIGYVEELPGANTQGKTFEKTKKNLIEAIRLVLDANKLIIIKWAIRISSSTSKIFILKPMQSFLN